jgi:hypothetical protein
VSMQNPDRRSRITYGIACVVVIALGLASRRYPSFQPAFVAAYAGDALWALLVLLLAGIVWPSASTGRLAVTTAVFALGIELSQLSDAAWLEQLRARRLGGLVLGFDFAWSDLPCYAAGVAAGTIVDPILQRRRSSMG